MNKLMDDMIIKLYELNERYHDTKEKMAWLGSSLYFAFSLAIMRILFIEGMQNFIHKDGIIDEILITGFLSLTFIFVKIFINFHTSVPS